MRTSLQNSISYNKYEVKKNNNDTFPKLVDSSQSSYPKSKTSLIDSVKLYSTVAGLAGVMIYIPCMVSNVGHLLIKKKFNNLLLKAEKVILNCSVIAAAPAIVINLYKICRENIIDGKIRKDKKHRKELS